MNNFEKFKNFFTNAGKGDMGEGNVLKTLINLSVPSIAMVLFHSFFHLVDTVFISWLGEVQMIAISYTFPVQIGLFAILEGIGNGLAALVAHKLGESNNDDAQKITSSGIALAYLLSLLWLPLMFPSFSNSFFSLLGASDPRILHQAWLYNMWAPPMYIFISFTFVANTIFRCQGNTVIPLKSFLIANGANLILDPIFIFIFGWGITGAAVATMIGRILGVLFLIEKLREHSALKVSFIPNIKSFMLPYWKKIIKVGLPVTITTGSVALGMGSVNRIITGTFGPQAVAAWMLGMRIEDIVLGSLMGINDALVPFLAFNYGRKDKARMKKALRSAFIISAGVTGLIGMLIGFFPLPIIAIFNPTREIALLASQALRITLAGYPLVIYIIIYNSLFVATGHSIYGTIAQVSRSVILRIPAVHFLAKVVSINNIWWFQPISFAGASLITAFYGNRLIKKIEIDEDINDVF